MKGTKCVSFLVIPDISQSGLIIAWELLKKWGILNSSYPYPKDCQDHQVNTISSSSDNQRVCTITGEMVKQVENRVAREQAAGRPRKPPSTSEPDKDDPEYEAKLNKLMQDLREYTIASFPSCFTDRFSSDMFVNTDPVRIKVMPDAVPVNRLTCRPVRKKLEIQASEQIKELLEAGIIEEATDPTP